MIELFALLRMLYGAGLLLNPESVFHDDNELVAEVNYGAALDVPQRRRDV